VARWLPNLGKAVASSGESGTYNIPFRNINTCTNSQKHKSADPELAKVMRAWPSIPHAIKLGILDMIIAAGDG